MTYDYAPPARRARSRQDPRHTALLAGVVAVLAWGALAFGGVYPWAYTPLAIGAAAVGAAGLLIGSRGRPPIAPLAAAFAAIAAAASLQLIPLPMAFLNQISPGVDAFLRETSLTYRVDPPAQHALSLSPSDTVTGLLLFGALALFMLGLSRLISQTGAKRVVAPAVTFGAVLAIVGIAQYALTVNDYQPLIYGFWKPMFESRPFGPFVNPNHFGGWMLMMLPLSMAVFYDALLAALESASTGRSGRIELVSSPQFGTMVAIGGANLVMALSLVMTRSRSALASFAVGVLLAAWAVARRQQSTRARLAVAGSAIVLLAGAAAWAGNEALTSKFVEAQATKSAVSRVNTWKDTIAMLRQFPLTGVGFNAYGTGMLQYQTNRTMIGHFREAHNDYLQVATEGGLLVGIPVVAAVGVFVALVRRRFREAPNEGSTYWLRVGAVIGLVSIALQSMLEFSLQMPGNAVLFALLAALAIHRSPNLGK